MIITRIVLPLFSIVGKLKWARDRGIIGFSATPVAVKLVKRSDGGDDKLPQERNVIQVLHENIMRIIKVRMQSWCRRSNISK